jgi:4-carboxymuconolactone decarboxylase
VTRDNVPEGEKGAYDEFIKSRGSRPNVGPYSLLLHMPEMAQRLEALRTYLRGENSLTQKLQEIVMITVAREMDCAFIWHAHAAAARQAGVRDDIVDNIRDKRALTNLDPDERAVVHFTRELLQNRRVSQPTFDAAMARFGQRGTMTLTNLIACYAVLAYNMNTYEIEAPAHPTEKALPVA